MTFPSSRPFASVAFAVLASAGLLLMPSLARAVEIQEVTSPGGITAWLVEDRKNPIITLTVAFAGGQSAEPAGKEGLADMMSGLLDEGAGPLDSKAFQSALESNAISLSFDAGRDGFSASLSTLTETSEEAFRLMRFALTKPRFDPEPVARIKGQIIAGIRARENRPRTIAARTWWRSAFPDHPMAGRVRNCRLRDRDRAGGSQSLRQDHSGAGEDVDLRRRRHPSRPAWCRPRLRFRRAAQGGPVRRTRPRPPPRTWERSPWSSSRCGSRRWFSDTGACLRTIRIGTPPAC